MRANQMKHNRILVALSLADGRDPAFERALALARASGAELYLLHAVPANQPFSLRAAERLKRAADLRQRAEAVGVSAQTVEQHGDPAEIIVLHADARPVDLIVMGTERRTGWARFRQRSVAERVLRRTKRPILVVRRDDTGGSAFENVLVAVDLSPVSRTLIDTTMHLFGGDVRQLTAIHAVESIEAASALRSRARWMVPEYRRYVLGDARRQLEAVMRQNAGTDIKPKLRVAIGAAAEMIRAHSAYVNADLIVMGRSKRFMHVGSTAVRVLRTTGRALLVVPPTAAAQTVGVEESIHKRQFKEVIVSGRSLVIVPVDGSTDTERTVEHAVSIAGQRAADLHAVQVVPRDGGLWLAPENETALRARLRALGTSAENEGVVVRMVTLRGTPESVIPAYAQLNGASLIVVGRNYGTSRFWRSVAVTSRLSRTSPVPVVVVPPRMGKTASLSVKRIVAAVDFTVASAVALRTAADLSTRHGAHLTILHAMGRPRRMVFSGGEAWRLLQRLPAEAKVLAERLKRKALAFGSGGAEPVVVTGDADRGIVETATDASADLIVMGVAPRTWIDAAGSGSTLRGVLRRARIPVLVLPVVAGAHEWIDDVRDTVGIPSTADAMARRAA
jgi:nucleotide-binding universal stress UspA family protein